MDGTLLSSASEVLPSSRDAIRLALEKDVKVILATGKARPAAIAAMKKVGLAGEGLVVSEKGPGVFLQGLAVYGPNGELVDGGVLDADTVLQVVQYSLKNKISVCGFLGDTCITPDMTDDIVTLHKVYYEPLAQVMSGEDMARGPPVRKMLMMSSKDTIKNIARPYWEKALKNTGADTLQAVDTMLEIVPRGWNKWVGIQSLLANWDIPVEHVMAVGDGENDLEMIQGVGIGVAMGNAVPVVKQHATAVVSSNDDDGVAEAIEKYILS